MQVLDDFAAGGVVQRQMSGEVITNPGSTPAETAKREGAVTRRVGDKRHLREIKPNIPILGMLRVQTWGDCGHIRADQVHRT